MMAARKKKKKRSSNWGGRRPGAGRPPGTGTGPSPNARINRVVVMLNNDELKKLKRMARKERLPLGTAAYQIVANTLRRQR